MSPTSASATEARSPRPLEGCVAIVTGAATGIGKAIALALGAAGARVTINHLDTAGEAATVAAEIEHAGGEAIAVAADVSKRADFETLVDATFDRFGRWDVLVNNAGVAIIKPFADVTDSEFDNTFAVNVKGTFNGCQLALERHGRGRPHHQHLQLHDRHR
jgi:3-oxoacyl-[acyl-carrier protein] reductase